MSDIKMVDVLIHIDETLGKPTRDEIRQTILDKPGVLAAMIHDDKPHLLNIEYNPDEVTSGGLLDAVTSTGVHAELVGL